MKSIYIYSNYRKFLENWYAYKKKASANYSYKRFAEEATLNSPNYLALIVSGSRDLTIHNIHQFNKALLLRSDEFEYFEALVLYCQSKVPAEKSYYQKKLKSLRKARPQEIKKENTVPIVLSKWYTTGILVLAHDRTKEDAVKKVKKEMRLPKDLIENTIDSLIKSELLIVDQSVLKVSSQQVTLHDPKNLSLAQESQLREQLMLSQETFAKNYKNKTGKFLSHSLTVPPKALNQIQNRFVALMEELTQEMDEQIKREKKDELLQVNIQIFKPQM